MKLQYATAIVEAADNIGVDVRLYNDYSGRGMFGAKTTGVVGSQRDLMRSVACAAADFGQYNSDEVDGFVVELERINFDNMGGHDLIMY